MVVVKEIVMSEKYQTLLIVVLLFFNTTGVFGEEPDEESQPKYEYIQIFKSIPALFEYLLNALEERPEILEKNDVTVFKRNIDIDNEECANSDEPKTKKRDVGCDNNKHSEENTYNIDKRDAENRGEITKSTKAYEYGNSNVVTKGYEAPNVKRFASKILSTDDLQSLKNKAKREKKASKKFNSRRKRNVVFKLSDDDVFLELGNAFFGFEHFFGLDLNPEEIEERILTAEKLLEEYNSNKEKDK